MQLSYAEVIPTVAPAPAENPTTPEKVHLGKLLYFDTRLSSTKKVSCNTCHSVDGAIGSSPSGTDGFRVSTGIAGLQGGRNAPTVWNSGLRSAYFWDGRARSLEEQAKGPILNPVEMGMGSEKLVEAAINAIPGYRNLFKKAFPKSGPKAGVATLYEIAQAIAAYERTLNTPDSPFDRFQKGETSALSKKAEKGWTTFQAVGCIACHGAPTFSKQDFFISFPIRATTDSDYLFKFNEDPGRYQFTHQLKDRNRWRVPSLRNVAITAPYFHNGAVDSLDQAVRIMGRSQLSKTLSDEEVGSIVEFLKSLTGKIPVQSVPKLP